jgi:hypothetical protein
MYGVWRISCRGGGEGIILKKKVRAASFDLPESHFSQNRREVGHPKMHRSFASLRMTQ